MLVASKLMSKVGTNQKMVVKKTMNQHELFSLVSNTEIPPELTSVS